MNRSLLPLFQRFLDLLAHGLISGSMAGVTVLLVAISLRSAHWHVVPAWSAAAFFYWSLVAIHEMGHAFAAWCVGYRIVYLEVWPVRLIRTVGGLRLRRCEASSILGGACYSVPVQPPYSPRREWWSAAGGPLTTLVTGAGLVLISLVGQSMRPGPVAEPFLFPIFYVGSLSLGLGYLGLFTVYGEASRTDSRFQRKIREDEPEIERAGNLSLLLGASVAGVRPRDWDAGLIESLLDGPDDLNVMVFMKARAFDRGEFERALEYQEAVLSQVQSAPPRAKAALAVEAAFLIARVQGNAVRARELLDSAGKERVPKADRLRAEAAILLAENRPEEASACAKRAVAALRESFLPGFAVAERDWLELLIAEATTASHVEPALPAG